MSADSLGLPAARLQFPQQLVETGHVDVMVSIGPKFFYTRSLPCTLWFFDKGKAGTGRARLYPLPRR